MSTFTPDLAAALAGPEWLRRRRLDAVERLGAAPFPTTDEEVWRYSRIGELDPDRFTPLVPQGDPPGNVVPDVARLLDEVGPHAGVVALCNGRVIECRLDPAVAAQGVTLGPLGLAAEEPDADGPGPGVVLDGTDTWFGTLNDAYAPEPVVLHVPRGVEVEAPVVIHQWLETDGLATFPRIIVRADDAARVRVCHHEASPPEVEALTVPIVELSVGPAAHIGYVDVQDLGSRVWRIAHHAIDVDRDGSVTAAQAGFGGDYARTRVDCRLSGRGSSGELLAAYFGRGEQMLDFRTFQEHAAPDTTSELLFKGVLDDRSQSVYTGLIKVDADARGTNAFQTNRNVKLSDDAWAESVPNLEIENNDVRCSHASTVGPIDEEQRFYLESRGVPPLVTERLIVAGFFDEVFDRLPVPAIGEALHRSIARQLRERQQELVA